MSHFLHNIDTIVGDSILGDRENLHDIWRLIGDGVKKFPRLSKLWGLIHPASEELIRLFDVLATYGVSIFTFRQVCRHSNHKTIISWLQRNLLLLQHRWCRIKPWAGTSPTICHKIHLEPQPVNRYVLPDIRQFFVETEAISERFMVHCLRNFVIVRAFCWKIMKLKLLYLVRCFTLHPKFMMMTGIETKTKYLGTCQGYNLHHRRPLIGRKTEG